MYLFYLIYISLTYVNDVIVIKKIIRIYKLYLNFICLKFVLYIIKTAILILRIIISYK